MPARIAQLQAVYVEINRGPPVDGVPLMDPREWTVDDRCEPELDEDEPPYRVPDPARLQLPTMTVRLPISFMELRERLERRTELIDQVVSQRWLDERCVCGYTHTADSPVCKLCYRELGGER